MAEHPPHLTATTGTTELHHEPSAFGIAADAAAIVAHAEAEAEAMIKKAEADAADLVKRRTRMAEDKIAAAERAAIAEVRAKVADVAVKAAASVIADTHGAAADKPLIDKTIAGLASVN